MKPVSIIVRCINRISFLFKLLIIVAGWLVLMTCNRPHDDFNGDKYLNGQLLFYDTLQVNFQPLPLGNRIVKIANYPSDTLNFLYSVRTDSDGYFSFQSLINKRPYDLFFEDTVNTIMALAYQSAIIPSNSKVLLQATPDYKNEYILHFVVVDTTGGSMENANLCVFNSTYLYDADSCAGSIFQATTDSFGRATIFNVTQGNYYIRAKAVYNGLVLTGSSGAVPVTSPGVTTVTMGLVPQPYIGSLSFMVIDANQQPVPMATICVYDNLQIYNSNANTVCSGAIAQLTTDIYGHAILPGLLYGAYYFSAHAQFGTLSLSGNAKVNLNTPGTTMVTIPVK